MRFSKHIKNCLKYIFYFGAIAMCLYGMIFGAFVHDYRLILVSAMFGFGLGHFGQAILKINRIERKYVADSEQISKRLDELKVLVMEVREKIENGIFY